MVAKQVAGCVYKLRPSLWRAMEGDLLMEFSPKKINDYCYSVVCVCFFSVLLNRNETKNPAMAHRMEIAKTRRLYFSFGKITKIDPSINPKIAP